MGVQLWLRRHGKSSMDTGCHAEIPPGSRRRVLRFSCRFFGNRTRKRRWIQNALEEPPAQLFANVWDATDTKPHFEFMSGKSAPVDPGFLTKIWSVGFSCRTASFLNRSADDANVCISCRAGTTGDTFEAVVQTLRLRRPLSFACENVPFGQI